MMENVYLTLINKWGKNLVSFGVLEPAPFLNCWTPATRTDTTGYNLSFDYWLIIIFYTLICYIYKAELAWYSEFLFIVNL